MRTTPGMKSESFQKALTVIIMKTMVSTAGSRSRGVAERLQSFGSRNLDWNLNSAIYLLAVLLWEGFLTSLSFSFPNLKNKSKNTHLID